MGMSKYLKFKSPADSEARVLKSEFGLKNHGLQHLDKVYWNLPESSLYEEIIFRNEGKIVQQTKWDGKSEIKVVL